MKVLGIDEAGRGPVIGSLFMAGVMLEGSVNELKKIGVKDSKLLKHEDRIGMAEKIKKVAEYEIIEVTPKEIDEAVESEESNLNFLETLILSTVIILECSFAIWFLLKWLVKNLKIEKTTKGIENMCFT